MAAPIPVKCYFLLLRGSIPPSTRRKLQLTPTHLASATLSITLSATLNNTNKDGVPEKLEPRTYTIPLRTAELVEGAHIAIRNGTGAYVEHMALEGRNNILTDYWIPGPFVQTGMWTFEVEASLPEGEKEEGEGGGRRRGEKGEK